MRFWRIFWELYGILSSPIFLNHCIAGEKNIINCFRILSITLTMNSSLSSSIFGSCILINNKACNKYSLKLITWASSGSRNSVKSLCEFSFAGIFKRWTNASKLKMYSSLPLKFSFTMYSSIWDDDNLKSYWLIKNKTFIVNFLNDLPNYFSQLCHFSYFSGKW